MGSEWFGADQNGRPGTEAGQLLEEMGAATGRIAFMRLSGHERPYSFCTCASILFNSGAYRKRLEVCPIPALPLTDRIV